MKRLISVFTGMIIILAAVNVSAASIDEMLKETALYVYNAVPNPQVGSVGGEWAIVGLKKSGADIPREYFDLYYKNVENYVSEHKGVLHERKYTEYSRVILALTAIGKNPADVAGYNLLLPLGDYTNTVRQGLNGAVWALIALDSGNYDVMHNAEAEVQAAREKYIKMILDRQLEDGGWAVSSAGTYGDTDITAMAIRALAPYRNNQDVNTAIEYGLSFLSMSQTENGGFLSYDTENSESAAQVLMALSALDISYNDIRFVKNGKNIIDFMTEFYVDGGGFLHTDAIDLMASEQCLCALTAARETENKNSIAEYENNKRFKAFMEQMSIMKEMVS